MDRKQQRFLALVAVVMLMSLAGCESTPVNNEQEIIALEDRYMVAIVQEDRPTLERLYASDYYSVTATGVVFDRAAALASYGPNRITQASANEMRVRFYGDAALVIGRYDQIDSNGPWSGRFTAVWVRRGGTWQLVSEHFSQLH
jgi:ketosteroid isomerase-like protein